MPSDPANKSIFIGIEIGGTKLQLVSGTPSCSIIQTIRYAVDPTASATGIQAQIEQGLRELDVTNCAGIGVGFGGPVAWQTGIIQTSHQIQGWSGFNLKSWLEERTNCPVWIDNDANVAALAEAVMGSGKGRDPVFYMTIGSGIGGGLVVNNSIYHGAKPGEVEIGHLRLTKAGNILESACSGWAVNKKVRAYMDENPGSLLAKLALMHNGPEAALLLPALDKEDADAQQILNAIADDLAFALSNVVHLFHPEIIIIGGGLSQLGEYLRGAVASHLSKYVMHAFLPPPAVALAWLGENVVPAGALELAKKAYYATC